MRPVLVVVAGLVGLSEAFFVSMNGSDNSDGLTPATAWRSMRKASFEVSRSNNTESIEILIERGGLWLNDPLHVMTTGNQVTVGSYGNTSLPQPLLQHSRGLSVNSCCIKVDNASSPVVISDLHLSGCATGIMINPLANGVGSNLLIESNVFLDIRTPFVNYNPANPVWATAVVLGSGSFSNTTIRNNVAGRIDTFFNSLGVSNGLLLDSNTVQGCSGNCYNLGRGSQMILQNSVMLRDASDRLFLYGTTDVIVGTISGYNALLNNDFNARGEYQGGPDGCAFDLETSAAGFVVHGNTFYRSWGAGIMIFGHATTSHNITISSNVFAFAGCVQNRDDKGGIAVMCPNNQKPSGQLLNNTFFTCPGVPAIYSNPNVPGCADDLVMKGNTINGSIHVVEMPQVTFEPPPPTSTSPTGRFPVKAVCTTLGAVLRYTTDGSKPSENSPVIPASGISLPWPGPVTVVNVRAFKEGMIPSVTNGAIIELNYILGREATPQTGPNGVILSQLSGRLDEVILNDQGNVTVYGWVYDPYLFGDPSSVVVEVDFKPVFASLANIPRPDLAPNPNHGFYFNLPKASAIQLQSNGTHVLQVKAIGTPSAENGLPLPLRFQQVVCSGRLC
eukprot:TRINITY_DN22803_c0_g1_i1.p1 TRINITY_DN22803_c0_g1~~TRINITY_DN22803_c0_g1_i1.p1  ORF type:complete len:617 (+),score=57.08 TRINITY_DN22803_c0_g1_i1:44-1894(+)